MFAKIWKIFVKLIWTILVLIILIGCLKVFIYRQKHQVSQQPQTQGLDVKSGKEFDKQFKELEQFMDDREKAKKAQKQEKQPAKQKPEANSSKKEQNELLKRFDEKYNFDGA